MFDVYKGQQSIEAFERNVFDGLQMLRLSMILSTVFAKLNGSRKQQNWLIECFVVV